MPTEIFVAVQLAVPAGLTAIADAAAARIAGRIRIEPDTIGDNCYYLGFLFTLTSLQVTMCALTKEKNERVASDVGFDDFFCFEAALSSTTIGAMLRVPLFQLRSDPVPRVREARILMQESNRVFRYSMALRIAKHKRYPEELIQKSENWNAKIMAASEKALEQSRASLGESCEEFSFKPSNSLASPLKKFAAKLSAAVKRASENVVNDMGASTDEFAAKPDSFRGSALKGLAELADNSANATAELESVARASKLATRKIEKSSRHMSVEFENSPRSPVGNR